MAWGSGRSGKSTASLRGSRPGSAWSRLPCVDPILGPEVRDSAGNRYSGTWVEEAEWKTSRDLWGRGPWSRSGWGPPRPPVCWTSGAWLVSLARTAGWRGSTRHHIIYRVQCPPSTRSSCLCPEAPRCLQEECSQVGGEDPHLVPSLWGQYSVLFFSLLKWDLHSGKDAELPPGLILFKFFLLLKFLL